MVDGDLESNGRQLQISKYKMFGVYELLKKLLGDTCYVFDNNKN